MTKRRFWGLVFPFALVLVLASPFVFMKSISDDWGRYRDPMVDPALTAERNAFLPIPAAGMVGTVDAQTAYNLGPYGNLTWSNVTTATNTNTLRALDMTTLITGTPTVNTTYTTDSATNLCALFPFVASRNAQGFTWDWYLKNTAGSALTITLAAGSGVTIVGTGTVAQNFVRHFKVNIKSCRAGATPAATIFSLETTAF
jgi:hypothetical protein